MASRVLPNVFLGSEKDAADLDYLKASNVTHVLNVSTHIPCFHENTASASVAAAATALSSSSASSSSSAVTSRTTINDHSNGNTVDSTNVDKREAADSSSSSSLSSSSSSSTSSSTSSPTSTSPDAATPWRIKYKRLAASDNASQNLAQYFLEAFGFIEEALRQRSAVLIHCQAGISRSSTILIAFIMYRSTLSMLQAYKFVKGKRQIISPNLNFMGQLLEFEQKLQRGEIRREDGAGSEGGGGCHPLLGDELAAFAAASTTPSEASMSSGDDDDADERFESV